MLSRCVPVPSHELRELRALSDIGIDVIVTNRPPERASSHHLAALDLTRCPRHRSLPGTLDRLRGVELFLLVQQDHAIAVQWANTIQARRVTVIVESPNGPPAHALLIRELRARFRRRQTSVAGAVATRLREEGVGHLSDLAQVLLRDITRIRYPKELAQAAGIAEKRLRDLCRRAGFERSSHFLMFVRWLAYEILIGVEHVHQREALAFIGIRDWSNLARQTEPVREWLRRRSVG